MIARIGTPMTVSLMRIKYHRPLPTMAFWIDISQVAMALMSQLIYTMITRMLRQLKYVGAVSRTANAVPKANETGSTANRTNRRFLLLALIYLLPGL